MPITTIRGKRYGRSDGVFGSRYELDGAVISGNLARRLRLLPYTYGSLMRNVREIIAVTLVKMQGRLIDEFNQRNR